MNDDQKARTGSKLRAFSDSMEAATTPEDMNSGTGGALNMDNLAKDSDQRFADALDALFQVFDRICEGAIAVDRQANIALINGKYLDLLGLDAADACIGQPIENIIPNSRLRQVVETGEAVLLDALNVDGQQLVVTRLPLFDENGRDILGAVGFVLYDKLNYLRPMISKYAESVKTAERARQERALYRRAKYSFDQMIGDGPAMTRLKQQARRAANSDTAVMLLGETGTGKELLAQAIHAASNRGAGPFVGVNVAAVPEDLLEAEFFGAVAGAYTGASKQGRKGKFLLADGGTLFLDEIGDMPLALQAKLLRVLQEREFEALGSDRLQKIDVRVIAATSRDMQQLVDDGLFRADLYFRLHVLPLQLPPLRARKEDLPGLCTALLAQIAHDTGLPGRELSADGLACLEGYDWPGNIRELRNALERAVTLSDRQRLTAKDFSDITPITAQPAREVPATLSSLEAQLNAAEKQALQDALAMTGGKKTAAAKLLGIARSSFYEKLEKHGLSG